MKRFFEKLLAALRAFAVLGVIWGVLLGIVWVSGAWPESAAVAELSEGDDSSSETAETDPESGETSTSNENGETAPQMGAAAEPVGDSTEPPTPTEVGDAVEEVTVVGEGVGIPVAEGTAAEGTEVPGSESPATPTGTAGGLRFHVTLGPANAASSKAALTSGDILGDNAAELLVATGSELAILSYFNGAPVLTARVPGGEGNASPSRPLILDLNGDQSPDLIGGHFQMDAQGGPDGGQLWVAQRNDSGGLEAPHLLAPTATRDLHAHAGNLLVAHWTDAMGRRPSEIWSFAPGASPRRTSRETIGQDVLALGGLSENTWWALDGGHLRSFGEAQHEVEVVGARGAITADTNGDGAPEVVVFGSTVQIMTLGEEGFRGTTLDSPELFEAIATDIDADGDIDLIGATRADIVLLQQDGPAQFERSTLVAVPGTLRLLDIALWNTGEETLLVAVAAHGSTFELFGTPLERTDIDAPTPAPLANAPFVLTLPAP